MLLCSDWLRYSCKKLNRKLVSNHSGGELDTIPGSGMHLGDKPNSPHFGSKVAVKVGNDTLHGCSEFGYASYDLTLGNLYMISKYRGCIQITKGVAIDMHIHDAMQPL